MEDSKSEEKQFEGPGKEVESREKHLEGSTKDFELREKQHDALIKLFDEAVELGKRSFSFSFRNNFISTISCNVVDIFK